MSKIITLRKGLDAIVEIRLLGTLTGEFGNARHRLALAFALLNLILQNLSYILVDMEIVTSGRFEPWSRSTTPESSGRPSGKPRS